MNEKENRRLSKQEAFQLALRFWNRGNLNLAEIYALRAMEAGSKTSAPKLLEAIAKNRRSKNTAITLSSFYWDQRDLRNAEKWATLARQFGSTTLAQQRLDEIAAHKEAVVLHKVVENFSPPIEDTPPLKMRN